MSQKRPPFNPDALYQKAISLHNMGKLDEADGLYRTLLSYFPDQPEILTTHGVLSLQQGRQEEGVAQLQKSLSISPRQPVALYNLGLELQKMTRLEEAVACYDKAILLNPNDVLSYLNRGNSLKDLKRCDEALTSYNRAIALKPDLAAAYWNKALLRILTGNYAEGWQLYEWGWKCAERGEPRNFGRPRWLGDQPIAGRTLLIHTEQGLGDAIQFCRYAPLVEALGAQVILEVPAALVTLLSTLEGNITIVEKGRDLPVFDLVCPVMSLPLALKTTLETIPATVPYLRVDQDKLMQWRQRLGAGTRPRIGLVWSGSMTNKIDLNPCCKRHIPLEQLQPLFQLPMEFHALQKDIRPEDAATLSRLGCVHTHQAELKDFSDTAALVQEMDLVISVCTSVAHLGGAMGHPTWVMLPFSPDYRWMLERTDSPWYPSVTLIRQREISDWSGVIAEVTQRLGTRFQT